MCTVLLPPGDNPIVVNKYIISKAHEKKEKLFQNLIANLLERRESEFWTELTYEADVKKQEESSTALSQDRV